MSLIIQVYEYNIEDYTDTNNRYFREELLCENECGQIKSFTTPQTGSGQEKTRASCDLLQTPETVIEKKKSVNRGTYLYTRYPSKLALHHLQYFLKASPNERNTLGYTLNVIGTGLKVACSKMDELTANASVAYRNKVSEQYPDYVLTSTLNYMKYEDSYVLCIKSNKKIIALGDIHGSFHTFWRHMLRLRASGVIRHLTTMELHPDFMIVFIGDVVDRGNYSMDILLHILRMIAYNPPGSVIYNRGNHEHLLLNRDWGFQAEVETKYIEFLREADVSSYLTEDGSKYIFTGYESKLVLFLCQRFWASCPCAVVVKNTITNQQLWFSHGGIPVTSLERLIPAYYTENVKVIGLNKTDTTACLWYDFVTDPTITRKHIPGRVKLFPHDVIPFMIRNGISFVFRGHQDNYVNSFLLSSHQVSEHISGSRFDLSSDYTNNNLITVDQQPLTTDAIATIKVDDAKWLKEEGVSWRTPEGMLKVWPVLTISTSTDINRNLVKDGIIVIDMDSPRMFKLRCRSSH